ncbi:MAG: gfo/Idh/MocA family oxidoreductase [Planctomycetota bacterium]|nr:MAG: gfo/Idh/MocA family oxidoreductase [Planctomycetota bacterium]
MTDSYPIAVWGVGPAGFNYLKALCAEWRLDVVGLINRNPERRRAASEKTGVPGFADLDELLAQAKRRPQLIVIATANPTHKDFTIQALQAGCHVFLDKPMGQDLDEARSILAAAEASDRYLQVGFEYRYGSMTGRLKELQQDDAFGELTCIDILDSRGHWWPDAPNTPVKDVWRLNPAIGGGPLLHCGIHELDLMRYYAGEVERVQAFVPPTSLNFYPQGIPDHLTLELRFASGASGSFRLYHNIAATWYRPIPPHTPVYHRVPGHSLDITITGTKGSAIAEIYAEAIHLNRFDHDNRETVYLRSESFCHHSHNSTHHNTPGMIIEFALRCRDGLGPIDHARDAYRTTVLGHVCEQAVQAAIADGWTSGPLKVTSGV